MTNESIFKGVSELKQNVFLHEVFNVSKQNGFLTEGLYTFHVVDSMTDLN